MEQEFNPYAAPQAPIGPLSFDPGGCWRQGKVVFLRVGTALPCRCVKCNEPAETPTKARKISWHAQGWLLLIFINVLLYLIVRLCVRKKATIHPGLCARHRSLRNTHIGIAWLLGSLGVVSVFLGAQDRSGEFLVAVGVILLFVALMYGVFAARLIFPKRIDDYYLQLRGFGRPYLDSLPEGELAARQMY